MKPLQRTLIALAASLALNGLGEAATRTAVHGGSWSQTGTWQDSLIPVSGDDVVVALESGPFLMLDVNYTGVGLQSLLVTNGSVMQLSPVTLTAATTTIGALAKYYQTDGIHNVGLLALQGGAASGGMYTTTGSGILNATTITADGPGQLNLQGGSMNVADTLQLFGSSNLAVSGGTLSFAAGANYLSLQDNSSATQTGGTVRFADSGGNLFVYAGTAPDMGARYTLSGGKLLNISNLALGGNGSAPAVFVHSGGSNLLAAGGLLEIGSADGAGSYQFSGGVLSADRLTLTNGLLSLSGSAQLSSQTMTVGEFATGTVNHSGGTANISGTLSIGTGTGTGGTGLYLLSGTGVLNAQAVTLVAGSGSPALSLSGGTMNVAGQLSVGTGTRLDMTAGTLNFADASGAFSLATGGQVVLSGGSLLNATRVQVGGAGAAAASFTQTGGTHQLATGGSLLVGAASGAGSYQLLGGSLSADNLTLGAGVAAPGSFAQGAGALTTGTVRIGEAGSGSFVQTGGSHVAQAVSIGTNAGSSGSYTATGAGSSLSVAKTLVVGDAGAGRMDISGGAVVSARRAVVGFQSGGSGSLSVADAGSKLTLTGNLYLGNDTGSCLPGGCTLSISNGGLVSNLSGNVNAQAVATVSGTNASWVNLGTLFVGWNGSGTLHVLAGGQVSSGDALIDTGGVVSLSGANSRWANTGDVSVGLDGPGSLSLGTGTQLSTGTLTIGTQGLVLLQGGGLSGDVLNGGSLVYQGGSFAGALSNDVTGVLSITGTLLAGGTVSNLGSIQLATGTTLGGSSLVNDGSITLSGGTLGGGLVTVGSLGSLSGTGAVTATGLVNHGTLTAGAGQLTVVKAWSNDGLVQLSGPLSALKGGTLTNTGAVQGLGALNLAIVNSGTVEALGGGTLALNGAVSNLAGGTLAASAGNQLLLRAGLATNAGTIALTGGSFSNNSLAMTNTGQIDGWGTLRTGGLTQSGQLQLSGGSSSVFGSVLATAGSKTVVSGASSASFYDAVDIQSGAELRVSSGATATFFGAVALRSGALLSGTGAKFYEGSLSVGNSPGLAVDAGDVHLGADNVYLAEIGGTTPGTGYDLLQVGGLLSFGGTLKIVSWHGYTPTAGQSFDLFDWGSSSGYFSTIDTSGLTLAAGTVLDTSRLMVDGTLTVQAVPEPGSWALMLGGLAILLRRASRQGARRAA